MLSEDLLRKLSQTGVLDTSDEEYFELTENFVDRVENHLGWTEDLNGGRIGSEVDEVVGEELSNATLADIGEENHHFAAYLLTLSEHFDGPVSHVEMTVFIDHLYRGLPAEEKAPANSIPLHGDWLGTAASVFDGFVTYIWLDNCDSCDQMAENIESVLDEHANELLVFAIYGPEWSERLQAEFEVVGGPTTLFVSEGSVDTRLHGAHPPGAVRTECEKSEII